MKKTKLVMASLFGAAVLALGIAVQKNATDDVSHTAAVHDIPPPDCGPTGCTIGK